MKTLVTLVGAALLAAGGAQASGLIETHDHEDTPAGPVVAEQTATVRAGKILTGKELARRHLDADAKITVSDFTAPGPRSTYSYPR